MQPIANDANATARISGLDQTILVDAGLETAAGFRINCQC
jgi:hypothetical protein